MHNLFAGRAHLQNPLAVPGLSSGIFEVTAEEKLLESSVSLIPPVGLRDRGWTR